MAKQFARIEDNLKSFIARNAHQYLATPDRSSAPSR
jgi:hypothetical protein